MPDGFIKFVVSNVKELEVLLMQNRKYAAEVIHAIQIQYKHTFIYNKSCKLLCKTLVAAIFCQIITALCAYVICVSVYCFFIFINAFINVFVIIGGT